MQWVAAILALIPAVEKIINNPAITAALSALVKLFVKSESEKVVDTIKENVEKRRDAAKKRAEAIKNAKKSYTKDIENIINRSR